MRENAICPYCGNTISENDSSIDHIIPKQLGGPEKFKVISCITCNNKISKIEQSSMRTLTANWLMAQMYEDGFEIKGRRKRNLIPLQKEVGVGFNAPVKFYYDTKKKEKVLMILSPPQFPLNKDFLKDGSFVTITPVSAYEEDTNEKMSLTSLTNKIILGSCTWLWGDKFSKTKQADELRERMWNPDFDKIIEMKPSDKHIEHPNKPGVDALENRPHHTILIGLITANMGIGIFNLFGSYESSTVISEVDDDFKKMINKLGIVLIPKTTKNEVLKMTWQEYEKFKLKS
jgi:hypothetical protein